MFFSFFCLSFLFLPGQNYYSTLQDSFRPPMVRQVAVKLKPADYPVNRTGKEPPLLTADAMVVMDLPSAVVLTAKNENLWLLPASTVKMMTALVALEHYRLNDVLQVGKVSNFGQDMKLMEGEKMTVINLLYGLLVSSANDAALVLAQNYPGGERVFVAKMNQKARELHLRNTYFANPTGLDVDEQDKPLADFSYTTALDLAHLAAEALKNETFRRIVATPRITVTDVSGRIKHQFTDTNQLLGILPGVEGVKTGWTDRAGECLVTLVGRNGKELIIVVLGSQDRFGETAKLIKWVFGNYRWESTSPTILM